MGRMDMSWSLIRRSVSAFATMVLVAFASLFLLVTPASAAMECNTNEGTFPTPGVYTDVNVKLCAASEEIGDEEMVTARAYVKFSRPIPLVDGFEQFELALRLERNDKNIALHSCELKDHLNDGQSGSAYCDTEFVKKRGGGWTADGVVTFNINNDGGGAQTWTLIGSPRI